MGSLLLILFSLIFSALVPGEVNASSRQKRLLRKQEKSWNRHLKKLSSLSERIEKTPSSFDTLGEDKKIDLVYFWGRNYAGIARRGLLHAATDPDVRVRDKAVYILGRVKDPTLVTPLIKLLQEQKGPRGQIIAALGNYRSREAVPLMINFLGEREAATAAKALGQVGDRRAIEPLKKLLTHKDNWLATNAARSLAMLGDSSGYDFSSKQLIRWVGPKRKGERTRLDVNCSTLGLIGSKADLPLLRQVVKQGNGGTFSEAAARAIIRIMDREGMKLEKWRSVKEDRVLVYTSFLEDMMLWTGGPSLYSLGERNANFSRIEKVTGESRSNIFRAIMRDSDKRFAQGAIWKITYALDPQESIPLLRELLKEDDPDLQKWGNYRLDVIEDRLQRNAVRRESGLR